MKRSEFNNTKFAPRPVLSRQRWPAGVLPGPRIEDELIALSSMCGAGPKDSPLVHVCLSVFSAGLFLLDRPHTNTQTRTEQTKYVRMYTRARARARTGSNCFNEPAVSPYRCGIIEIAAPNQRLTAAMFKCLHMCV